MVTGVVISRSDVVVTQPVVLQQRLHGVGRAADVAGVHGLRVVQLLLAPARLVAVDRVAPLARRSSRHAGLQHQVLQVGLLGGRHRDPFDRPGASVAAADSPRSLGGLREPVGRPVLAAAAARAAAAAAVAGDAAAVEDAVLLPQVPLQQREGVEGFAAEATRELLAVRGDVTLELHLGSKRLAAEDALPGLESC